MGREFSESSGFDYGSLLIFVEKWCMERAFSSRMNYYGVLSKIPNESPITPEN